MFCFHPPRLYKLQAVSKLTVKVGIPEFLKAVGNGVETHMEKLEKEVGDFQKLLTTRTLRLKSMGIPCKHVLILSLPLFFFVLI